MLNTGPDGAASHTLPAWGRTYVYVEGSLRRGGVLEQLIQAGEALGAGGAADISLNATRRWDVVTATCETQ